MSEDVRLNDPRSTVTVEDGGTVTVQVYSPGATIANLQLEAALNGSALREVQGDDGVSTILFLSEDAVKIDGTLTVDKVAFDTTSGATADVDGEVVWNPTDHTLDLKVNGATLQAGQEFHVRIYNNTGTQIDNGEVVTLTGSSGTRPYGGLADATVRQSARAALGVATHDIAAGAEGFITGLGMVRDVNTAAFIPGTPLFLHASTPGAIQGFASPPPPTSVVFVGICVTQHATQGVIYVNLVTPPTLTELVDVDVSSPVTNDLLVYNATTSTFENKTPSITTKQSIDMYIDQPVRGKELSVGGGIEKIIDAGAVSTGSPQGGTNGCGKLVVVVNAGSDLVGDVTITGDTVDRNTGVITVGDTEVVTLDGTTTDASGTDAQGNVLHDFIGAYVTSKWFQGAISISTTEVNVSDFDVWNVAFHQFGDTPTSVEVDTLDVTALATNTAAWFYGYLYSIECTNGTCNIERLADIELPAADIDASDAHYRRKIGNIGKTLDPSTDGVWVELFPGPFNQTYWEDITLIMIFSATDPINLS